MLGAVVTFFVLLIGILLVDELVRWKYRNADQAGTEEEPEVDELNPRARFRFDLMGFCEHYFPDTFNRPWTEGQTAVIAAMQSAILYHGRQDLPLEPGEGSTSIIKAATIWAAAYRHRRFIVVLCESNQHAAFLRDQVDYCRRHHDAIREDFPFNTWAHVQFKSIRSGFKGVSATIAGQRTRPDLVLIDDVFRHMEDATEYTRYWAKLRTFLGSLQLEPYPLRVGVVNLYHRQRPKTFDREKAIRLLGLIASKPIPINSAEAGRSLRKGIDELNELAKVDQVDTTADDQDS